jgi:hypothetical protein
MNGQLLLLLLLLLLLFGPVPFISPFMEPKDSLPSLRDPAIGSHS